jgi:hypothetical protein
MFLSGTKYFYYSNARFVFWPLTLKRKSYATKFLKPSSVIHILKLDKIIFPLVPNILILFRFSMQQLALKSEGHLRNN